jgi:hypothetical protein
MQFAHARDRRRGHLEDLPPVRDADELRAIQRREIDHLAEVKEFEDASTAVDEVTPVPAPAEDPDDPALDLEELEDDVDLA